MSYLEAARRDQVRQQGEVRCAVVMPERMYQGPAIVGEVRSLDQPYQHLIDPSDLCLREAEGQGVACRPIRGAVERLQFRGCAFEIVHEPVLARTLKFRYPPVADLLGVCNRLAVKRPLVLLFLLLTACGNGHAPAIADDLNLNVGNSEKWPARLSQRFPLGTPQADVMNTLQSQGFEIDPRSKTATLKWSEGVCEHHLSAAWKTNGEGRLTAIDGRHWPACL